MSKKKTDQQSWSIHTSFIIAVVVGLFWVFANQVPDEVWERIAAIILPKG